MDSKAMLVVVLAATVVIVGFGVAASPGPDSDEGPSALQVETARMKIREAQAIQDRMARHRLTARVARSQAAYEHMGRRTLRGFSNPMNIVTDSLRGSSIPRTYGYDDELAELQRELDRALGDLMREAGRLGDHPAAGEVRAAVRRLR